MTCDTCVFFRPTTTDISRGECRAAPPMPLYDAEADAYVAVFPTIREPKDTYCGIYEPDETVQNV